MFKRTALFFLLATSLSLANAKSSQPLVPFNAEADSREYLALCNAGPRATPALCKCSLNVIRDVSRKEFAETIGLMMLGSRARRGLIASPSREEMINKYGFNDSKIDAFAERSLKIMETNREQCWHLARKQNSR